MTAGTTIITHIPRINGQTNNIDYPTGLSVANDGTNSFKYRFIENLYGNVYIILDDNAYIQNKTLYIDMLNTGEYKEIESFEIPLQQKMITVDSKGSELSIRKIGLDQENQWLILPSEIGGSTVSYVGDFFYLNNIEDMKYILTYGGTWDNSSSAGLFNIRAILSIEDQGKEKNPYGSRLILK